MPNRTLSLILSCPQPRALSRLPTNLTTASKLFVYLFLVRSPFGGQQSKHLKAKKSKKS